MRVYILKNTESKVKSESGLSHSNYFDSENNQYKLSWLMTASTTPR